jgi:TrmH family RNA methyltransferase
VRLLEAALAVGAVPLEVYVEPRGRANPRIEAALDRVGVHAACFEVPDGALGRLGSLTSPQPLAFVMARHPAPLEVLLDVGRVVVAAGVADPGNLGAVVRAAAAAGFEGVVVAGGAADPFGPRALRAAAGAAFVVPIAVGGDDRGVARAIEQAGFVAVVATARGGEPPSRLGRIERPALILGSEAHGVPAPYLRIQRARPVGVPMRAGVESLNVGQAAALLCYALAASELGFAGGSRGAPT